MCSTTFKLRLSGITCTTSSLPTFLPGIICTTSSLPQIFGMIYTSSSLPQIFSGAPDTPSGPHRKPGNLRRRYTSADTKSDELPPKISKFQKLKIPKTKLSRDYCHALRMSLVLNLKNVQNWLCCIGGVRICHSAPLGGSVKKGITLVQTGNNRKWDKNNLQTKLSSNSHFSCTGIPYTSCPFCMGKGI